MLRAMVLAAPTEMPPNPHQVILQSETNRQAARLTKMAGGGGVDGEKSNWCKVGDIPNMKGFFALSDVTGF